MTRVSLSLPTFGITEQTGSLHLAPERVGRVAGVILRYGVVALLLFFGAFKFSATEAQAIQPLVAHSPLLAWLYRLFSVQAVSNLIGTAEIATALAISLRRVAPRISALGSLAAALTFATTLSFLVTTPGVWVTVPDFVLPVPNEGGGFILKDLLLLGASLWSYSEATSRGGRAIVAPVSSSV